MTISSERFDELARDLLSLDRGSCEHPEQQAIREAFDCGTLAVVDSPLQLNTGEAASA
jgi:hypothetical protein